MPNQTSLHGYVQFRSLHPKKWSLKETSEELRRVLESVSIGCVARLHLTTATWSHKPKFRVLRSIRGAVARMQISTDHRIFVGVDQGVPPHSISPRSPVSSRSNRPSALATRTSYRAKTTPRSMRAGPGGHSGPVVYKPGVWHPGYPGRFFMATLQAWAQKELNRRAPEAVRRGLARGIKQ